MEAGNDQGETQQFIVNRKIVSVDQDTIEGNVLASVFYDVPCSGRMGPVPYFGPPMAPRRMA